VAEPAAVSLGDYLQVPDYKKEVGFVHQVEADLQRVLDSIPRHYLPLTIFIDDLDRCSPRKIAEVVEAVNLFLAGHFPNCMFVLGMDAEMVAAALQASHKEMTAALPEDAAVPLGWRFMDKFIQLPFVVPPARPEDVARYADSLLDSGLGEEAEEEADRIAREAAARIVDRTGILGQAESLAHEKGLSTAQVARVADQLEAQFVQRELDAGIALFDDRNETIRTLIKQAAAGFSHNPRDMKRFVNAFRFQYFLWWAYRAQTGKPGPRLEQLQRWVVFSMKWPEVVRWVWRTGGREWRAPQPGMPLDPPNRLRLLETMAAASQDLVTWQAQAKALLLLDAAKTPWLNDDDLLEFFYTEAQRKAEERLSAAAGAGLW
jgi:hypothetical protein